MTTSLATKWLLPCVAAVAVVAQEPDLVVVRGRAIDRDGKPVEGCAVGLFAPAERFTTKELLSNPLATTNAAGRYELRAKKDGYQVVVVTTKDHQVWLQQLQYAESGEHVLRDALMLPGTTLRGRVRDAAGKPIAGALVRVEDPLVRGTYPMTWFESQAVTDASGIFEVPGVPRTGLHVTASARGFPAVSRLAAHDSPLDLTLTPTGLVRGRVVDADGKPAAGMIVQVNTVERGEHPGIIRSDADGRFELTAPNTFRFRISAYEPQEPHRQFSGGLLAGPADDVVVAQVATEPREALQVTLRVVDATTNAPVGEFAASWVSLGAEDPARVLLHHPQNRARYRGEAVIDVVRYTDKKTNGTIVVEAPGHGFAIVPVPDDPREPLIAELPRECVLAGQVIDDVTGKPAAGCAVRVLPHCRTSGSAQDPWLTGMVTGVDGRYRVGGLAPGRYDVQVYAAGRQASAARTVEVTPDQEGALDLAAPVPLYLDVELVGDIPPHCLGSVSTAEVITTEGTDCVALEAVLPQPVVPIAPRLRLGPVGRGAHRIELRLPTRDRLGSGLTIPLGEVERGKPAKLLVPDLRRVLHRGRVNLPSEVPAERIAVLAHRARGARGSQYDLDRLQRPFAACLASDGSFVIDLPPGSYTLQLVDLESKLVFHTEEQVWVLDEEAGVPATITPSIRWLQIDLVPAAAGAPAVIRGIQVEAAPAAEHTLPAMLGLRPEHFSPQTGFVDWRGDSNRLRWLVPRTHLKLQAIQNFCTLSPSRIEWQDKAVDKAVVEAGNDAVHVTLRIPPPPDAATIVAPPPK